MAIKVRGKVCVKNIANKISDSFFADEWHKYMEKHFGLTRGDVEEVEWDMLRRYLQKSKLRKCSTLKIMHQQINTMAVCERWGTAKNAICPLCLEAEETAQHVCQCKHPIMVEVRNRNLLKIKKN